MSDKERGGTIGLPEKVWRKGEMRLRSVAAVRMSTEHLSRQVDSCARADARQNTQVLHCARECTPYWRCSRRTRVRIYEARVLRQ